VSSSMDPPLYDAFAEWYEGQVEVGPYNALYDRPAVLELLGDVDGRRILDAGCGPGVYAEELLARGADVVAFDESPEMVRLARLRCGDRIGARVHDLSTPLDWLDDESFDAAVMALVIHYVDDRVFALREIHRVLRSGGRLIVSTHHPTSDWRTFGGSYFDVERVEDVWHRGEAHVRFWRQPLTESSSEFADAGFLIERIVEPLPVAEMADQSPEDYAKLTQEPGFIAFALRKPPEPVAPT
jgi:SAM-dependent methyltransferase